MSWKLFAESINRLNRILKYSKMQSGMITIANGFDSLEQALEYICNARERLEDASE